MAVIHFVPRHRQRSFSLLPITSRPDSTSQQDTASFRSGPDPRYSRGLRLVDDPLQILSAPPASIWGAPFYLQENCKNDGRLTVSLIEEAVPVFSSFIFIYKLELHFKRPLRLDLFVQSQPYCGTCVCVSFQAFFQYPKIALCSTMFYSFVVSRKAFKYFSRVKYSSLEWNKAQLQSNSSKWEDVHQIQDAWMFWI